MPRGGSSKSAAAKVIWGTGLTHKADFVDYVATSPSDQPLICLYLINFCLNLFVIVIKVYVPLLCFDIILFMSLTAGRDKGCVNLIPLITFDGSHLSDIYKIVLSLQKNEACKKLSFKTNKYLQLKCFNCLFI